MTVGILGGGQLGRMLALAGYPLGMRFRFLDHHADAVAGQVGELTVGEFGDAAALDRFVRGVDVVTYEFENVPVSAVKWLAERVPVFPSAAALETAQDRLLEKQLFRKHGIDVPSFEAVDSRDALAAAVGKIGLPAVVKTRRMGYDGKGQRVLRAASDVDAAWTALGAAPGGLIVEGFVPFDGEVSIIAVRGRDGGMCFYPLAQNTHEGGILRLSLAPAPIATKAMEADAQRAATAVMTELNYVGVLAIEFFVKDGRLLGNEMAPRVHNSGHWTIEGAVTSQFENHLRAVCGLPLGECAARGHAAMINLIGFPPPAERVLSTDGAHLHLYGKEGREGRKVGHITLIDHDHAALVQCIASLNARL